MGTFDTLVDGDHCVQVKCFGGELNTYHVGDKVPELHYYHENYRKWDAEDQLETYTIVMDPYQPDFALIKDRVFVGFTDNEAKTHPPYVFRYGELQSSTENPTPAPTAKKVN